ncbi:MAG: photosynthetic complex putative assembly protein PuhB [Pseudomonadota bacterium]
MLFHDEEDKSAGEPIKGLPAMPPKGERVIWQGKPDPRQFVLDVVHPRAIAGYIIAFSIVRLALSMPQSGFGVGLAADFLLQLMITLCAAFIVCGLIAYAMARASIYTITNKRIVLRFGAALRKYTNVPFSKISAVDLRETPSGMGTISFSINDKKALGLLKLWPHVRMRRKNGAEPVFRQIPDARTVAFLLADTMKQENAAGVQLSRQPSTDRQTHEHTDTIGVPPIMEPAK